MKPSFADCSHDDLTKAAKRLGFILFEGKKHTKVKDKENRFVTTIPRHSRLKKQTVNSIVEAFIRAGIEREKAYENVKR